ncbi:hypothetical protein B0H13DRAFT_1892179 [Mycena leptocephala]|nr:hypothetical protein B0H13DRAFT_1892179 [Mycena leptocephala]
MERSRCCIANEEPPALRAAKRSSWGRMSTTVEACGFNWTGASEGFKSSAIVKGILGGGQAESQRGQLHFGGRATGMFRRVTRVTKGWTEAWVLKVRVKSTFGDITSKPKFGCQQLAVSCMAQLVARAHTVANTAPTIVTGFEDRKLPYGDWEGGGPSGEEEWKARGLKTHENLANKRKTAKPRIKPLLAKSDDAKDILDPTVAVICRLPSSGEPSAFRWDDDESCYFLISPRWRLYISVAGDSHIASLDWDKRRR